MLMIKYSGAHDIYRKKRILHHDISMSNLAYYRDDAGRPIAVLIDFDLAIKSPLDKPSSEEHVGTVPFMSREYLLYPDCDYGLHHDLESFYYCVIWHGLGYETLDKYPCEKGGQDDILKDWRVGSYRQMALIKSAHLASDIMHEISDSFLDESFAEKCKILCGKFEEILRARNRLSRRKVEGTGLVLCRLSDCLEGRPTKVTAPMLIDVLGMNSKSGECEELCCLQFGCNPVATPRQ